MAKRKPGRPPTYDRASIIERVVEGLRKGTPLTHICAEEGMPDDDTIRNWAEEDQGIARAIARARDAGFDAIALEVLTIAEERPTRITTQFGDKVDPGFVQHQRNRVETRLKLLAKWDPKRYGERIDHTSSDGSMSPPSLNDMYRSLSGNAGDT